MRRKQKDHQNKVCHKDWDQSFCPRRPQQPRFPERNLLCLNKNDDACNKTKQDQHFPQPERVWNHVLAVKIKTDTEK